MAENNTSNYFRSARRRAYVNITEFAQNSVYRNAWTVRVEEIARG